MSTMLDFGTLNRGDHASQSEIFEFLEGTALTSLTEMMSEPETREAIRKSNQYGIFEGRIEDSQANPVVWNYDLIKIHRRKTVPLIPAGTRGGKHNMRKSMVCVLAEVRETGHEFWFNGIHQLQTVGDKDRRPAAKDFVHGVCAFCEPLYRPCFTSGDWNAVITHDVMAEVRRGDWKSDAIRWPELHTHDKRNIDYFIYRNLGKNIRVTKAWTVNVQGTDHEGKKIRVSFS